MEGTVQYEGSGDVFFAFYNGNDQLTEMPKKDSGLGFNYGECNNGASVAWNNNLWAPTVTNLTKTKTKCTLYFSTNANSYSSIEEIVNNNLSRFEYDKTKDNNLRYVGYDGYNGNNNYIDIGDRYSGDVYRGYYTSGDRLYREYSTISDCYSGDGGKYTTYYNYDCSKVHSAGDKILWRIIGVMNNVPVVDESGGTHLESLIKIIRADSIGAWSWDSSASGVNYGEGVNEWSQADIMTTLNYGAYWDKSSGLCYSDLYDKQIACDFTSSGLTESVKDKLAKVRWNIGTVGEANYGDKITASYLYEGERSNNHGKICNTSGYYCNDGVSRKTTWDGYIGLMYPSDYRYAVGGTARYGCLTTGSWNAGALTCHTNDWLYDGNQDQWTMTAAPNSSDATNVFYVSTSVGSDYASTAYAVRPVAYLKSSVKIQNKTDSNYGSSSKPFLIEGVS